MTARRNSPLEPMVRIAPWLETPAHWRPALRAGIEAVFIETAPSAPTDPVARAAFHDLWLGQYLRHEPHLCWLAINETNDIVGYLVGCWENPATSPRFAALSYVQDFAAACLQYPAHLHMNLTATARGFGVGGRLIEAFAQTSVAHGVRGMHVVTGATMRNVGFYQRCGFAPIARAKRGAGEVLMLGRRLV